MNPTDDELYAVEVELELRRRLAEEESKRGPSVTKASPGFEAGSAIRQSIPNSFRGPVNSIANILRQGPEVAALGSDVARIPFRAADNALGLSDKPTFSLENFTAMTEAGDTAFGKPHPIEKLIGAMGLGYGTGKVTGAVGPIRSALAGGMGYLGGEAGSAVGKAAGQAVGRKFGLDEAASAMAGEGIGGVGGSLLFGIPTMLPGINTANRLAKEGLKGIHPRVRDQMIRTQDDLTNAGIFSMPSQLSETPSPNLRELQNRTLASGAGSGSLEERIQNILNQARNFGRKTVTSLGPIDDSTARANEVQDVVERVVNLPKQRAGEAAKPYYKMLELDRPQLPVEARFRIANQLADLNEQVGLLERSTAAKAVNKAANTVVQDSVVLQPKPGNVPFRLADSDIYSLDNYMSKDLRVRIENLSKLNATSKDMVERAGLIPAYEAIRKELMEASPILGAAKNAYRNTRQAAQEEVRSTGIPAAKPLNMNPGPLTPSAKWEQFNTIVDQGNPDDVRRAAALMRGRDEGAFRDVVKNWLRTNFEQTVLPGSGNTAEPKVFAEKLLKHPNLDAMIEEAAKGVEGIEPTEFAVGFKKALKILQAAGRPTQSGSSMDATRVIGNDPLATAGRFGIVHELGKKAMLASKYFEWAQNRQWKKLYEALDDPQNMRRLSQMADMAEMNPRTAAFLSTIVGGTVSID